MPSVPKYNQRSTSDLNYAKRRVIDAEKKGIAKLVSPGFKDVTNGDAQIIAEKIVEYLDEIIILIQKSFGYFDDVQYVDGTIYELKNISDAPKVFSILILLNKIAVKTLSLSKKLRHVIKFVNSSTIETLKNKLADLSELVDIYLMDVLATFISDLNVRATLGTENFNKEVESIVSDLDSAESEDASQLDLWDPNAWFDDTELGFLDNLAGAVRDAIGVADDDESSFQTAIEESKDDVREGLNKFKQPRTKQYVGKKSVKMYQNITEKFQDNISEVYEILIDAIDSYNEARIETDEVLDDRKDIIKKKYTGSGLVYSVGNKYAEQMYNSQGLYK